MALFCLASKNLTASHRFYSTFFCLPLSSNQQQQKTIIILKSIICEAELPQSSVLVFRFWAAEEEKVGKLADTIDFPGESAAELVELGNCRFSFSFFLLLHFFFLLLLPPMCTYCPNSVGSYNNHARDSSFSFWRNGSKKPLKIWKINTV